MRLEISNIRARALAWFLLVLAKAATIALLPQVEPVRFYAENSLLENLQAMVLATGSLLYISISFRTGEAQQLTIYTVALLCFSFLLRELDLAEFQGLSLLKAITEGPGRDILLVAAWSAMAIAILRSNHNPRSILQEAQDNSLLLHGSVCFFFLLVGGAFDRGLIEHVHSTAFEELAETNAYLVLAMPAFFRSPVNSIGAASVATDTLKSG